ncbi:serine protease nudel-like [Belonocnema kinseyi]|uniref:serine protease nudel-like n=1 Tax=Belonocnema kinseyi TaxID=2817044 RepID=UPI00143D5741|nr:serine protease nudel-like [Belonocnema kinseyi]
MERMERNIAQSKIDFCKQNRESCQKAVKDMIIVSDSESIINVEKIMKLMNIEFIKSCLECRRKEFRGLISNHDESENILTIIPENEDTETTEKVEVIKIKSSTNFTKIDVPHAKIMSKINTDFHIVNRVMVNNTFKKKTIFEENTMKIENVSLINQTLETEQPEEMFSGENIQEDADFCEPFREECFKIFGKISWLQIINALKSDNVYKDEKYNLCRKCVLSFEKGHPDCYDSIDEENCGSCTDFEYHCRRSRSCIPLRRRCDRKRDCTLNDDELDCFTLTDGKYVNLDPDNRPHLNTEGIVTQFSNGAWYPVCYQIQDKKEYLAEMGSQTCDYLAFSNLDYVRKTEVNFSELKLKKSVLGYKYSASTVPYEYENKTCTGLYIRCKSVIKNPVHNQLTLDFHSRIRSYQWPWHGAIFSDGKYRCPAVLLETNWLLSNSECSKDINLAINHTIGFFGMPSYQPDIYRPHQQVVQIDEIRIVKNSNASLFHLKDPVDKTRYVQTIFEEKRIFPPTENDTCLAVGVDKKYVTRSMFVKPVLHCSKCHRCYIANETVNCDVCGYGACVSGVRGFEACWFGVCGFVDMDLVGLGLVRLGFGNNNDSQDWSGTVSCLGPGGWYPAGVFQNLGSNCGFNKTETIISIDYINAYISESMNEKLKTIEGPYCDGIRCFLGKCIPWNQVCDGKKDCTDDDDEQPEMCEGRKRHCEKHNIGCMKCKQQDILCGNGKCIPKEKFCDGKNDCSDGVDEPKICNCASFLNVTAKHRICDNKKDCFDKSDEDPNLCGCLSESFHCKKQNVKEHCISPEMVCDSEQDCPDGEDEMHCRKIQGSLQDRNGTGEVMKRSHGLWHSECFSAPVTSNIVGNICQSLGFSTGILANETIVLGKNPLISDRAEFHIIRLNERTFFNMRDDKPLVSLVQPEEPCHQVFVNCV